MHCVFAGSTKTVARLQLAQLHRAEIERINIRLHPALHRALNGHSFIPLFIARAPSGQLGPQAALRGSPNPSERAGERELALRRHCSHLCRELVCSHYKATSTSPPFPGLVLGRSFGQAAYHETFRFKSRFETFAVFFFCKRTTDCP